MIPIPPSWAIQIAVLDSVTVSMAALTKGIFSRIPLVNWVLISTSFGNTEEKRGTRETSSKVRHSKIVFGEFTVISYLNLMFCFIYQTLRLLSTEIEIFVQSLP
jgi:hypothetical protein